VTRGRLLSCATLNTDELVDLLRSHILDNRERFEKHLELFDDWNDAKGNRRGFREEEGKKRMTVRDMLLKLARSAWKL
jgi:hypothetical protein